jgi:DNA-directed RNA polymerase specialized sigma24 family protein
MGACRPKGRSSSWAGSARCPRTPPSFEELFLEVHDRLYRALYFITGSSADAEELMRDAFLKLWERWDRLDAIDDPVAYLFRVRPRRSS